MIHSLLRRTAPLLLALTLLLSSFFAAAETSGVNSETVAETTSVTTPAPPEDAAKTYTILLENGTGVIRADSSEPAFWEYPRLPAGQARLGTLVIVNNTPDELDLSGTAIELPYGDTAAMAYLSRLTLTLSSADGHVLYHGRYTDVMGESGLKPEFAPLGGGQSAKYLLTLRCDFAYTGIPADDTATVQWQLGAKKTKPMELPRNAGPWILGAALGVLTAALLALVIIRRLRGSARS